jgi:tetratricopeptide (TPR) repeat protein
MEKITEYLIKSTVDKSEVKAWNEIIMLPTYEIGNEEKNPIFLEKRVYQGSSGAVYPYPVIEKLYDNKKDKPYNAFFIENEYLKVMILPELGGRIQMAYDKVKKRHFVYYNQVIKPALVGLTGPWISGGIEFNWPQHHRPSTFLPTECSIEKFSDGSITIWCNEVERMFHTKGMTGFTLYPGKAYIEVKVQIYNRTPFPQTFLWWANPAVSVDKAYRSVFPPDVTAVYDHGKRDVSSFPIATGIYYKWDYSAGVDISRYVNIPVPTSYMAIDSKYDFLGGYEEDVNAGLLHVANHHINTGKKQWTWGNGDFGYAWDRNLTDEDGPYIELMTGMYCDNQPDFSWLQPYEEKSWVQYFMPYQQVGVVKNATKEALINIEKTSDENIKIILYTTSIYNNVRILLSSSNKDILFDKIINVSPKQPYKVEFKCKHKDLYDLELNVFDEKGKSLVYYKPCKTPVKKLPEPAKAALEPKDIDSIEQLFLTGQHLEQYRHATYSPMDYYKEGIKRENGNINCNNAVGLLLMRSGKFQEAQPYFEQSVKTQTMRNPNPYNGEPYYNLGWCKKMQGNNEGAYDDFYKSTWNGAWQDAGYMGVAQIDMINHNYEEGLEHIQRSLIRNWHNHKARQLKASFLRKLNKLPEAMQLINESLSIDKFNIGCHFEKYLILTSLNKLEEANKTRKFIIDIIQNDFNTYLEYALDFSSAGMYEEGTLLLDFIDRDNGTSPMLYYTLGYFSYKLGKEDVAKNYYIKADNASPDYCFPNKIEEVVILENAISIHPQGSKAYYYLGNFWYNAKQYSDAIKCWEKSISIDNTFPTVLRNLALAYYNKEHKYIEAKELIERAFMLNKSDARILMELDQLYKKLKYPIKYRLEFLEKHLDIVKERDDLLIERITLYNLLGKYEVAYNLINSQKFHPWEGGEGKITSQYLYCRIELAKIAIQKKNFTEALRLLEETKKYPENLGEGKLITVDENDINYLFGCTFEGLGEKNISKDYFIKATQGHAKPTIAFFYNDQQPDKIFYQGLAWRKLGNRIKSNEIFNELIAHGKSHLNDKVKIDYFAVSLPDLLIWDEDLNLRNKQHCNLVMALGNIGLKDFEEADKYIDKVLALDLSNQMAIQYKNMDFFK